ncbi:MAG: S8 family serine peptidase [Candidatus Aerophobetes bacterium]|nr:S8 family serine peptidase [Candidatus Aerophobetes bacterium]
MNNIEKEYIVVTKRGVNVAELDYDLASPRGSGIIPERPVKIAKERLGSKRMTHFMLTDEEAELLSKDERVISVEINPEHRDDIEIILNASQDNYFYKGYSGSSEQVNWGLRRCIDKNNDYSNNTTIDGDYEYALDGAGVDVVIQDTGIEPNHPEWEDKDGITRLQQIDWYTESGLTGTQHEDFYGDYDGHGTHCAGIAAGKTYGWAKGSHIFAQKLDSLKGTEDPGTGFSTSESFDFIRLWHENKTNGRPTVVNMSWGYRGTSDNAPTSGVYKGVAWELGDKTDDDLWNDYGIVKALTGSRIINAQITSVDTEIEEMIDAGIHVCIASGNNYYKADIPDIDGGTGDYDNNAVFSGLTRYYNRPSSPYSPRAFFVGNVDSTTQLDNTEYKDRPVGSSNRGPASNIWAPGTNITSTCSNTSRFSTKLYPEDSNYRITTIGGTSMASPQVAGLCALHLQVFPKATPEQLFNRIIGDTEEVIYQTENNDTDYYTFAHYSLCGSPNRMMFSRYGRQPLKIS